MCTCFIYNSSTHLNGNPCYDTNVLLVILWIIRLKPHLFNCICVWMFLHIWQHNMRKENMLKNNIEFIKTSHKSIKTLKG